MSKNHLPTVLVTHTLPEDWITLLKDQCILIIGPVDATELAPTLKAHLADADGMFTLLTIPVTESLLQKAPKLRVISNMAVGVDNIDVAACTRRKIPVGNTPGVLTESTADLTMALILSVARGLPQASLDARQGNWRTWSPAGWLGKDLYGSTLGIIGMGKIGKAVAKRATAFGMNIIYTDPQTWNEPKYTCVTLAELLKQSDIVTLHVPLIPDTRGLINKSTLALMKPSAILVNASRGPIVDMLALYQALKEKQISAAALDVTNPEPLPPQHPLFSLPNCLILPHIGSATWNTRRRMAELACENLIAGLRGDRLPNCVNPEVYSP